ncbi:uncharacterized protein P174DRAFT_456725 [Aspergillus novofumigatus IBT 16806]|uniref:Uncharacterized protein n=1 Tax=Aspergillus novofumigatus (strain IBT 16806) TaxID=1392255 RepID=A0A2I1CNM3_ASPN1|nr:uncharacterized protein P174DRAFT_456725 [Aspergillus novofumigatus IBT 16806]PKX99205.1 hypothetical protein P174DRAFT_456725 [Aspergillus novofumigatus IBT 16806]
MDDFASKNSIVITMNTWPTLGYLSSKADFRWVWWDPGQKELEKYKKRRRFLRWVPKCFRSYEFTTADAIWNPGPPVGRYPAPGEITAERLCAGRHTLSTQNLCRAVLKVSERQGCHKMSSSQMSLSDRSQLSLVASRQLDRRLEGNSTTDTIQLRDLRILYNRGGMPLPLNHSIYVRKGNRMVLLFPNRTIAMRQNLSMPCLLSTGPGRSRLVDRSEGFYTGQNFGHGEVGSRSIQKRPRALAYQMWSARMELQTSKCIRYNQSPLLGPPGSPESGLLGSFSSEHAALLDLVPRTFRRSIANPSSDATSHAVSMKRHVDHDRGDMADKSARGTEAEGEHRRFTRQLHVDNSSRRSAEVRDSGLEAVSPGAVQSSPRSDRVERPRSLDETNKSKKPRKKHQPKARHLAHGKVPLRSLSTWEARLAHDLNRKLEWLFEQLSPGRRPFHFALLANHWLNRETWVVLDPISRIPIEARRLWGDPRFNSPYPIPCWGPKTKYPESSCRTANRPHLNSWRVAVNRNRRASGLRDVVKGVALLEDSADEPPDGKVDPASWILRKPPQGFAVSTMQQDAYYEGGAGWQETLGDWQRVRRGYRIRKAIYEGRANRTRMKEIAVGLTRYFQAITNEVLNTPKTDVA